MIFNQERWERLIKSLDFVTFRNFAKHYLQEYYGTEEVIVTDGTGDGGNDAKVIVRGVDEKVNIQFTVQEKDLKTKIFEDVAKAKENVDIYGFQPTLMFFYSGTVSESKQKEYRREAQVQYRINLDIYDRKHLASDIEHMPAVRDWTLRTTGMREADLDVRVPLDSRNKALYEILTGGGVVTDVKVHFILAFICYFLHEKEHAGTPEISEYVNNKLSTDLGSRIIKDYMQKSDAFECRSGQYYLTAGTRERIDAIKSDADEQIIHLHENVKDYLENNGLGELEPDDIIEALVGLYTEYFDRSLANAADVRSDNREKAAVGILKDKIRSKYPDMAEAALSKVTKDILEISAESEYLAKWSTTQMFTQMFKANTLEEYVTNSVMDVYLDTQVLLPLLCHLYKPDAEYHDVQYEAVKILWETLRQFSKSVKICTTTEYLEEMGAHLWDAVNVCRLERLIDFDSVGSSRNVFYRFYKSLFETGQIHDGTFEEFLYGLTGEDCSIYKTRKDFTDRMVIVFGSMLGYYDVQSFEVDYVSEVDVNRYYTHMSSWLYANSYIKTYRAALSDIKTLAYLSKKDGKSGNEQDVLSWDSSLHRYSAQFIADFKPKETWTVYTPLKFVNRLSLQNFRVDAKALSFDIICITENLYRDVMERRTFIDLMSMFVGNKVKGDWPLLHNLRKLKEEQAAGNRYTVDDADVVAPQPIDDILSHINAHYSSKDEKYSIDDVRALMQKDDYCDVLTGIFTEACSDIKAGKLDENKFFESLNRLIADL